jgi:hypothetical protein
MNGDGLAKLAGAAVAILLAASGAAYLLYGGNAERARAVAQVATSATAGSAGPAAADPADAVCTTEGAPRPLAPELHESSGVAASREHPGVFWTHNDSGDPLLYAVDAEGGTVGTVRVPGASVEDWEDLALAPCPDGTGDCLFVGDIGDNDAARESITVYRVREPDPAATETAPRVALRLRYPDGPHDAEALFVVDGAVHVVTKGESGAIAVYRAPADARAEAALERVRELLPGPVDRPARVTAAAASADGRWVALRTLQEVTIHRASELLGGGDPAYRVDVASLEEPQGEGLAFTPDGSLVLTSEGGGGDGEATLSRLRCTLP